MIMKNLLLIAFAFASFTMIGQNIEYNLNKKGVIVDGYDVVAYFVSNEAVKGKKKHQTIHENITFQFSSEENLQLFLKDPKKYVPQYGGWCAYATKTTGGKVKVDPKTFEIRDGKLYLFYDTWRSQYFNLLEKRNSRRVAGNNP